MTRIALRRRFALLMAVDAPLHLQRLLQHDRRLRGDLAVTANTLHLGRHMRAVAEEHKLRQLVNHLRRNLPRGLIHMADAALRLRGKPGPLGPLDALVA